MKSPLPLLAAITGLTTTVISAQVLEIGSQRELMIDHHLIDSLQGAELRLQEPHNEGVAFAFDRPQEGLFSGYVSIVTLPDEAGYRAYYRGLPVLARAGAPGEHVLRGVEGWHHVGETGEQRHVARRALGHAQSFDFLRYQTRRAGQ
jgi:hypothetical protein